MKAKITRFDADGSPRVVHDNKPISDIDANDIINHIGNRELLVDRESPHWNGDPPDRLFVFDVPDSGGVQWTYELREE